MKDKSIAVLLMAYGSPDTPDDVEPYYTHIRGGRTPSADLVADLKERYRLVGGRTPLLDITRSTQVALQAELDRRDAGRYKVYLGMKHWHPYIEQAVREMVDDGMERAIGLVLAPHYSRMSVEGYYRYIDEAQREAGSHVDIQRIESWHLHEPYLRAVAERVKAQLALFPAGEDVTVVFTAHSLPERIVTDGDPYPDQLHQTSEALARSLGLRDWTFSYQSAGSTADPWLGPDLVDTVHALADRGVRNVLIASIGFVSDHLEILYDIDYEAATAARERGMTLRRTESLNASPDFVAGLADLVLSYDRIPR